MSTHSLAASFTHALFDSATILVGTLVLAGRRWEAASRLGELSDRQLRDIGLSRSEVAPHRSCLQGEIMRHELGRW